MELGVVRQIVASRAIAAEYRESAARLRGSIRTLYWDAGRRLFADTPDRKQYSQHANVLAVLAGRMGTSGHAEKAARR